MIVPLTASACTSDSPSDVPPGELPTGTWGAEMVGLIVGEAVAHVHVGCTKGDFPAPIRLDQDRRFSVSGDYLLRAYPIVLGPTLPAEFAGVLRGNTLTFSVAVNDTVEHELVVLGPVTATLGQEPAMGPCPICEAPDVDGRRVRSDRTSPVLSASATRPANPGLATGPVDR